MAIVKTQIQKSILSYLGYSLYSALLTQSSTAAPTEGSVVNKFSGITFTWARSNTGIYTITASSAIFSANKTVLIMSLPGTQKTLFNYVVTSTTVITLTTSTIAFGTPTNILANNTDGLLLDSLFEIRVYA